MKFVRFLGVLGFLLPFVSNAFAASDFQSASQLLSAARRGDTQTVQILINSGADVNYVDATGLSLVCTAVMNNDKRAIQVLQMYGADASKCDRQIKQYKQKARVASRGEEYGFFSGLSSSHILALSVVGVAAVIGGVALLTDAFDSKSGGDGNPSGGSHSGGGGSSGGSGSFQTEFTVPAGPAYLDSNFNIDTALANFVDAESADFNYLKIDEENNFIDDGLNEALQNYLLVMRGYHSIVSGYLGQYTFRNSANVPVLSSNVVALEGPPARVALITGNGINPAGSADSAGGIRYFVAVDDTESMLVDKYFNNVRSGGVITEVKTAFDLSGSGTVFNPFANVNESALAKIVAGWESDEREYGDLYGFVPNAQLAILRTGNGNVWQDSTSAQPTIVGTLSGDNLTLEVGDKITINGETYNVKTALDTTVTNPTVTVNGTTYKLASNSKMFLAECDTTASNTTANCSSVAIYIGTDGNWYVNSTGGDDIDAVYAVAKDPDNEDVNNIYVSKERAASAFKNFEALKMALNINNIPSLDVVAMVNVLDNSRNAYYMTVKDFAVAVSNLADASNAYQNVINFYYDYDNYINNKNPTQGADANLAFSSMNQSTSSASTPMIIMPAGDYLAETPIGTKYAPMDATFENYAPLIYNSTLNHNFMTVVAVNNSGTNGTSDADSVADYGDGTGSGKFILSQWSDSDGNTYMSRKCGLTGTGNGGSVDPWCFAASGPTAEMATAAAAGAVAAVKSAFTYMTNDQIFTLLALTAEGPFLRTQTNGTVMSDSDLASYLDKRYELPSGKKFEDLTTDEYLNLFKDTFGYGLINLERAIKPGYSVYYYSKGNIVSESGNKFWGDRETNNYRSSTALSVNGRSAIRMSFFDIVESIDGSMSLPRIWDSKVGLNDDYKHGLYMGDVLAEFDVDSSNKHTNKIGNITFDMAMSPRAYADNMNGLNDLKIVFTDEHYDIDAQYQRYLTDGESRFDGRANGVLSLVSNSISTGAKYKSGNFAFGAHAFSGTITDENLLENDPVVSSQYEPARLGFANGGAIDMGYNNDKFSLNVSFGNMNETNTVLGAVSDGLLSLNGANTQYVDTVVNYRPFEKIGLSMRATFANTRANLGDGIITELSDIKSNAFAFGADAYGFNFTAAMPLAVVDGKMGYDYADLSIIEKDGKYDIMINNPRTEYIDLSAQKRELRFSGSYKQSIGEFTDAGIGFIYRVNPGNTNAFGNESIFMFKLHHRLGI